MAISIVKAQPLTAAFTATTPLCQGTTVTFEDASTGGTGTIIMWVWYVNGTQVGGISSPTFSHFFPLGTASALIMLNVTDDGGNSNTIEQTVYFSEPPTASITIDPETQSVCPGASATMTVVCPTATGYLWSPGGAVTNPLTVTPPTYTLYSVTVTDANGCTVLAQQDVDIYANPTVSIPAVAPICSGASVTLTTTTTLTTGYLWSPGGEQTNSITVAPTETTTYSVVVTSAQGCTATASRQVVVNPSPDLEISISTNEICQGEEVIATATGGDAYAWSPGGLSGAEQTLTPNETTTYSVTATVGGLCPQTLGFTVTVHPTYTIPETITICEGESVLLGGAMQTEEGVYYDAYTTVHGCDSTIVTTLVVNPAPVKYTLNGSGSYEYGGTGRQVTLSDSEPISSSDPIYRLYRGNDLISDELGTGSLIDFGNQLQGTYHCIGEYQATGCQSIMNGYVTIVQGTEPGTSKIVANVSYGNEEDSLLFEPNAVNVTLFRKTVDVNQQPVVTFVQTKPLPSTALVEFTLLIPGDYYLKSEVVNQELYPNVTPTCFYQNALTVDEALMITVAQNQTYTATMVHYLFPGTEGTNGAGGDIVYAGTGTKSQDPAPDQIVILRDDDAGQIISVAISDENGSYYFEEIPDYGEYSLYLTSFQYQMWTPATFETTTDQQFIFNFVIDTVAGTVATATSPSFVLSNEVFIYPNPTKEWVVVIVPSACHVTLFDMVGHALLYNNTATAVKIDTNMLKSGAYLIQIVSEDGTFRTTKKLLIE